MFKRKFWKRGDWLTAKELNRIEEAIGTLNLEQFTANPTLPANTDFNNLEDKNLIYPISTFVNYINGPTYDSTTEQSESFTGALFQVCFNPGPAKIQIVVRENGPIYTRVRTITGTWREWTAITEPVEQNETP